VGGNGRESSAGGRRERGRKEGSFPPDRNNGAGQNGDFQGVGWVEVEKNRNRREGSERTLNKG